MTRFFKWFWNNFITALKKGLAMPLRIIRLQAENFKKLRAVDITPRTNVIRITGANGEGKSSLLDAIYALMGGRGSAPATPIRDGAEQATIQADLGKYVVYRTFTKDEKQPPICIRPKSGAGALPGKPIKSPQDLLDELLGDLTFDPLAFSRMKPKDQYEELRRIANLGPELDELDAKNAVDYDQRATLNRRHKEAAAEAKMIDVPEDLPDERVNVAETAEQLEKAIKHNALIEGRKLGRETCAAKMSDLRQRVKQTMDALPAELAMITKRAEERIADLERQIEAVRRTLKTDLQETADVADRIRFGLTKEADEIQKKLDSAEPLPAPKDVLIFKEQMANAQSINSGIDARDRYKQRQAEADLYEAEAKKLTLAMEERTRIKHEMIAAAKMPIKGLGLEDGGVTYHGIPFEQASSAEQLKVSVAIAMAANPELRILRIKDGSLLDSKSMAILEDMCARHSFQCWIESVSETGDVGIVMEDGAVKVDNYAEDHPLDGVESGWSDGEMDEMTSEHDALGEDQ